MSEPIYDQSDADRFYLCEENRTLRAELEAERLKEAVTAHHLNELVKALRAVLSGFDAGVFVRSTSQDGDPDWTIKLYPHLRTLAVAEAVIAKAEGR